MTSPFRPCTSRRRRAINLLSRTAGTAFVLSSLLLVASGCDRMKNEQVPQIVVLTPEGKFELVMERMESALADAKPSANSGIVSSRRCRYEVIPPASDDGLYRAEVTIETQVSLSKPHVRRLAPKTIGGQAADSEDVLKDEPPLPKPSATVLVDASQASTTETFELIYQDERWKLATQPKGELEKICFEFALNL